MSIEQEIQDKGFTAQRITPADIQDNIYFTSDTVLDAVRFNWLLKDHQDINERIAAIDLCARLPVMTFSAARRDIDIAMGRDGNGWKQQSLELLTFCVLVLKNGFTVTGESTCASPENFNVEIGRKIARENAINKVWPLMGYALKEKLAGIKPSTL